MNKSFLTILVCTLLAVIGISGCSRKADDASQSKQSHAESKVEQGITESETVIVVNDAIISEFPMSPDYMFPSATIGYQEIIPDNEGATGIIMMQTDKNLEVVRDFYATLIPEEAFVTRTRGDDIQGLYATYSPLQPVSYNVYLRVNVSITQPARNFEPAVLASQVANLEDQIRQYESLYTMKKSGAQDNDSSIALQNIQTLIDRLSLQEAVLRKHSTLITVTFSYYSRQPQKIHINRLKKEPDNSAD